MKGAILATLGLILIGMLITAMVGGGADIKAENETLKKQVEALKAQLAKKKKK